MTNQFENELNDIAIDLLDDAFETIEGAIAYYELDEENLDKISELRAALGLERSPFEDDENTYDEDEDDYDTEE